MTSGKPTYSKRCGFISAPAATGVCIRNAGHGDDHQFVFDLLSPPREQSKIIEEQLKEIERLRDGVRFALKFMYPCFPIDYNVRVHLQDVLDGKDRSR